jgi:hypothetical protein
MTAAFSHGLAGVFLGSQPLMEGERREADFSRAKHSVGGQKLRRFCCMTNDRRADRVVAHNPDQRFFASVRFRRVMLTETPMLVAF